MRLPAVSQHRHAYWIYRSWQAMPRVKRKLRHSEFLPPARDRETETVESATCSYDLLLKRSLALTLRLLLYCRAARCSAH
eukprot:IDg16401t1